MTLSICVAQLNFVVGDMVGNARKIVDAALQAYQRGARLLLTPELAICGYAAEDLFLRPAFIDACDDALKLVATETAHLKGLHIVVGHPARVPVPVFEARRERSVSVARLHNAASVLLDGAVTLFPALRFDFYDLNPTEDPLLPTFTASGQSDSRLSPKLGVTVKLAPEVILFGNYAQGFLAPTPSQVNNFFEFIAGGYTSIPNPDLRPETSESWEVGARYVGEVFSLQLTGFKGDYDNFISQQVVSGGFTPQNPAIFQFVNFNAVTIEGVEARAEMKLSSIQIAMGKLNRQCTSAIPTGEFTRPTCAQAAPCPPCGSDRSPMACCPSRDLAMPSCPARTSPWRQSWTA